MSITTLSPCIVLEILDLIRYDETRSPAEQARDLSSISLLSRRWSQASQQLLFRNVLLATERQYLSFMHVATSNTKLSGSVRQLKITIASYNEGQGLDNQGGIPEQHLFPLLDVCPRLYELDLASSLPALSTQTVSQLRQLLCHPLALRCTSILQWDGQPAGVAYQLALIWQDSLEFVILGGEPFCLLGPPPASEHFSGKLKEFRWTGFDRPSEDVLDWFLGEDPGRLQYLSLDSLPTSWAFDRLLKMHGPYLRSLRLRDLFGVEPDALRHCTALEEFSLDRGMDQNVLDILAKAVPTPAATPNHNLLRSSIMHLEFGVKVKARTCELLENAAIRILSSGGFPKLKIVTIKQWGGSWSLEGTVHRWRGILAEIDVLNGSPMRRTPSQRKNLPISKITNLFDSSSFPRIASAAVYRFMSTR